MTKEYPFVSAIMLAGRCPNEYVLAAIKAFHAQTYPHKELIIINNGKNQYDNSSLYIEGHFKEKNCPGINHNVHVIDTDIELTAGMARNHGIAASSGQILVQFDADYYHSPKRIESQIAALAENQSHICILRNTLSYSYKSGIASIDNNDIDNIYNTMLFIRPKDIDYPNVDKSEDMEIYGRLLNVGYRPIVINAPELAVKLHVTKEKKNIPIKNVGLSSKQFKYIKQIIKEYL